MSLSVAVSIEKHKAFHGASHDLLKSDVNLATVLRHQLVLHQILTDKETQELQISDIICSEERALSVFKLAVDID